MKNENAKILIVEDDKFLLKAYSIKLEKGNFDVLLATDGVSGFESAQKEKPSLIILDLMIPKMNGFEFLKKIKEDEELKNTPIIVVSNLGQKDDCEKAIELGAKEFLIKTNYSLEEIIKKINEYL